MSTLIRRTRLFPFGPEDDLLDVRLEEGRVSSVAMTLDVGAHELVIDAEGATLLPGLHDHHVHLRAVAAACASLPAGPPDTTDVGELARRLHDAAVGSAPGEWIRAVGYHESVAGDLDRWALDRLCPQRPVRIQHSTGELWMVNSPGIDALRVDESAPSGVERGEDGQPTGRIWREDRWLGERIRPEPPGREEARLAAVSARAAAWGVTGFTDTTHGQSDAGAQWLADRAADGTVSQRLHLMTRAEVRLDAGPLVTLGPVKVLLDDPTLPALDELAATVSTAHDRGRTVAIHCVTAVQAVLAVTALEQAGAVNGDRIEHAAVLPAELVPTLARLGITVVTQPAMAASRADRYLADVDPRELVDLWRVASLLDAGVQIAGGSDAPHGPMNPWRAMANALTRLSPSGAPLGPSERVTPIAALRLFTGWARRPSRPRAVVVGEPADLVLLTDRLDLRALDRAPTVRFTFVAGRPIYSVENVEKMEDVQTTRDRRGSQPDSYSSANS